MSNERRRGLPPHDEREPLEESPSENIWERLNVIIGVVTVGILIWFGVRLIGDITEEIGGTIRYMYLLFGILVAIGLSIAFIRWIIRALEE